MRFKSINVFSGEKSDGIRKKRITRMLREDSNKILDAYLMSFKYYNNSNCISLNISFDEDLNQKYIEPFKGYPVLHIPFDLFAYTEMTESEKIDFWLSTIRDTIDYVVNVWDWDASFFDDVYNKCLIQLNYH